MRLPVNAEDLRLELENFLGEAQYRKFLEVGVRGPRLRFWQEQAWNAFVAANPAFAVSLEDLAVALNLCHLHEVVLQSEFVRVFRGCIDYSNEYMRIQVRHFPYASLDPISDEGNREIPDEVEIWYCSKCREEYAAWQAKDVGGPG